MKIVQHCLYTGPAKDSAGSERVVEALTVGLQKLGHEVVMFVNPDSNAKLMPAPIVSSVPEGFDIIHGQGVDLEKYGLPWVSTVHGGGNDPVGSHWHNNLHYVCISDFIRKLSSNIHYVHNCINPENFIFSDKKDDYFLWLAGTDWGEEKGLFSAIHYAKRFGLKLKIAGTGKNKTIIEYIKENCNKKIEYLGAINGKTKAEILSKAKAVLNIGKIIDAFCLVSVEALISGTPVIARNIGAHPEILSNEVSFLCNSDREILKAIINIDKISPHKCHEYAKKKYSHTVSAKKYLQIYSNMIELKKKKEI